MEPTVALKPLFNEIAAAIHEKDGLSDSIPAYNFPERIRAIPAGGATLESIYISSPPDKTSYLVGETFDPTGLVVIAVFDNDKTLIIDNSELTFTPSGELEEDTTEVTISYQFGDTTKTAAQEVTVTSGIPSTLNECSWELISELSQNGTFADHFSVGDTKTIVLNGQIGNGFTANNLEIDLVVVGINHNAELEGDNLVHFMLGYKNGSLLGLKDSSYRMARYESGYFNMNLSNDNTGGWAASHMRSVIMGGDGTPTEPIENTLMSALPANLRAVMRSAQKWTNNVGGSENTLANITETTEFLCPIDEYELDGTTEYAYSYVTSRQQRYQYFLGKGKNIKILDENGSGLNFYFRGPSPYRDGTSYWCGATESGSIDYVSQYWGKLLHALLFV